VRAFQSVSRAWVCWHKRSKYTCMVSGVQVSPGEAINRRTVEL
jgi:hypothetical protein